MGRSSEILRDEIKFSKFVGRMRKRFSSMFNDMLRTQLLLKNIVTPEDWDLMEDHIQYDFLYDNHFAELKNAELMEQRINLATMVEPYVGKYYSQDYVRRNILQQTDREIIEQDELIEKEIQTGAIPDPAMQALDPMSAQAGETPSGPNEMSGELGTTPVDPEAPKPKPEGGEI